MTNEKEKISCRVFVSGRVQGVAFRWHAKEEADRLGVAGWIRNLPDGRVEAVIEGERAAVGAMLEWLKRGPPRSEVFGWEMKRESIAGELAGFEIR